MPTAKQFCLAQTVALHHLLCRMDGHQQAKNFHKLAELLIPI